LDIASNKEITDLAEELYDELLKLDIEVLLGKICRNNKRSDFDWKAP